MFVRTFEKGKRGPVGHAGGGGLAGYRRRNGSPLGVLEGGEVRLGHGWGVSRSRVVKRVYRLVITLEGESCLPVWFARDSVGNSDLATSTTTTEAVGQLPRKKPY